jgi:Holliday junction resolvasome RuvABC endonuclease subunit
VGDLLRLRPVWCDMNILALDLSLTATGWAKSIEDHGVETGPGKLRGVERLEAWEHWLVQHLFDRELIVLEGYAFGRPQQATPIGELGGVIRLCLHQLHYPLVVIQPAVLKKYATGKGNATKPDMRMELYKRSTLDIKDDNEVDALWLLAAAMDACDEGLWSMPKDRLAVLGKVDWPVVATS